MWHAEWTKKVLDLAYRFNVTAEVVLEPELQTDVLLNDDLFDKYFGGNPGYGR